ncbi:hypothetical protein JG687_00011438 [Phytophthora cactorum]|uniref:Uncharacterized protein n=1 Tax=Phytophthora cactorum TaxID=29920 RepID=A0A8T1U740_9STRA|nr:hypothetical protein JG687_00011438 [Phytophthora cactorum]
MRLKFWQRTFSDSEEEEDSRDKVEILQRCVRDTEQNICAAPDSILLKRARDSYLMRLESVRAQRRKQHQCHIQQERYDESARLARHQYNAELSTVARNDSQYDASSLSSPNAVQLGKRRWRSPSPDMFSR